MPLCRRWLRYGQIWDFDSTAAGWTPLFGTWTVHDGVYEVLGDPAPVHDYWGASMTGKPYWNNYSMETKVMCFPVYWDYAVRIQVRVTYDTSTQQINCYDFWISPAQSAIGLNKYVNTVETVLIRLSEPVQTNVWYIMKLEVNNNQITAWLDGVQKFSVTDNDLTSGKINVVGKGQAQFDYVKVTSFTPLNAAGDVNCDGKATVSDVVYTINYLFKGGPKPCQDCP